MEELQEELWRGRLKEVIAFQGGVASVARGAGLPPQTLRNHLERSKKAPLAHLRKVAEAFDVDFEWLSGGDGDFRAHADAAGGAPRGFGEAELSVYSGNVEDVVTGNPPNHGAWVVRSRALELAGFLPGDIVEFEIGAIPRPGEVVVAQIYDPSRPGAETVIRLWNPPYLMVHTADPSISQRPVEVDDAGERAKVMGAFVRMIRTRTR